MEHINHSLTFYQRFPSSLLASINAILTRTVLPFKDKFERVYQPVHILAVFERVILFKENLPLDLPAY